MPTVFDSFKPRLSHQLTSMQSARDKMNGYITESSLDLKDAARFTFDHGSKASKKIFASIPTQILRQKLDDRTTQHLEQHGDVHNRGATGTGLQQYSTRGQHGQHKQQGPQGQQGKETGSLNKQNDWRTSNPIPGMGEFRRRQDTDQTNAYDLDMLETQMKRVGRRVNFMSFAPELMPQRPKRNKKTSYNFTSRNQKTEQLAANRRKKKGKRRRTQRERNNSIRSATSTTSTTSTTSATSATSTTSAILAKVQRMQDKKKNIRKRKEVKKHQEKMERINASKKIQAIHRGKKERKKVELLKESRTSATRKIQSMHRGKQARKKVEVLKQSKKEESATRKIQSMHRGKQARHRVKEIKASRKIQAIHRGKKDRSRVQSMRKIKRDAARLLEEKNEEEEEDYDPDALFAEFASSSEEDEFSDNESEEGEFSDND
jgi:myosin heavy subunit